MELKPRIKRKHTLDIHRLEATGKLRFAGIGVSLLVIFIILFGSEIANLASLFLRPTSDALLTLFILFLVFFSPAVVSAVWIIAQLNDQVTITVNQKEIRYQQWPLPAVRRKRLKRADIQHFFVHSNFDEKGPLLRVRLQDHRPVNYLKGPLDLVQAIEHELNLFWDMTKKKN